MHIHINPNFIIDLIRWMIANPAEAATHIIAYASATVVVLATIERLVNSVQVWAVQWFPESKAFIRFLARAQYVLSATSDLVENLALNWRSAIAPKKSYTGADRRATFDVNTVKDSNAKAANASNGSGNTNFSAGGTP